MPRRQRTGGQGEEKDVELLNREVSHLRPGAGRAVWVFGGQLLTCKVTAEQTSGAYSLFEGLIRPQDGAPPHVQHREDECFYVLEGEFEFLMGEEVAVAGPGTLLYVPRGTLHAFKNLGEDAGRVLISQTPGGLHERFLEEIGEVAVDGESPPSPGLSDFATVAAIAAKYGIEMPPPPPG